MLAALSRKHIASGPAWGGPALGPQPTCTTAALAAAADNGLQRGPTGVAGAFVESAVMRFLVRQFARQTARLLQDPWGFVWHTLKSFRANHGLLLAGAVAYYALLSIVPLLILSVIALSHWVEQGQLLQTVGRYLAWLVGEADRPGPGHRHEPVVRDVREFARQLLRVHRSRIGESGHRQAVAAGIPGAGGGRHRPRG